MNTLSVVLITHNAAKTLAATLESVRWADEIIVLDSGSNDDTLAIAQTFGAQCYQQTDWQGFGRQRQIAQSYASSDYVLMLDSDEQVTSELYRSIQGILQQPVQRNIAYACARRNRFIGRYMKHCGWYPDHVIRLYLREERQYNNDRVHESLNMDQAHLHYLDGDLLHETAPNFIEFQQKQLRYAEQWALQRQQQGKQGSLWQAFSHSLSAFLKTYLIRKGFLDGKHGIVLSLIVTQYTFNKYVALWALTQKKG
ncbi:glycosyltransferase family 2 protein [Vibrio sp. AH4]|uniref:glycosyltransferase family 2 protein n=1 Tax=Vibrio sp. AH4 TaxID=2919577 RepID=UPI002739D773|nr:glycosyltransferase family 2 protein [Vibrio sp. AH4]MDP4491785.1 glycosyltransferase family 2 protein [Vibrio sp. AH4]